MSNPDPETIKAIRDKLGFTQAECAEFCHITLRGWQHWESGARRMPVSTWELFLIKAGLHPLFIHKR